MIFFAKRYRPLLIALSFFVVSLAVLSWNLRGHGEPDLVEKTFLLILSPFLKTSRFVSHWAEEVWSDYIFLVNLRTENLHLRAQNRQLKTESDRLREVAIENERLRGFLQFKSKTQARLASAEVVGRDSSSWFKTLLINKGKRDGLRKGMAVLAHDGLVGTLLEVGEGTAKVLLLTDYNSAVDALVQRSRGRGILEGRIEGPCELRYVARHEDVEEGDLVITSGLGGLYPKGLVIGKVGKVVKKEYGIFQYVEVAPTVDFSKLEEVLIALSMDQRKDSS